MQDAQRIFCSDDISDSLPEDEVDKLFSKLEKVEPPQAVIDLILSSVSKLPWPPLPADPGLSMPPKAPIPPRAPTPQAPLTAPETTKTGAADAAQGIEVVAWGTLDGLVVRREHCEPS